MSMDDKANCAKEGEDASSNMQTDGVQSPRRYRPPSTVITPPLTSKHAPRFKCPTFLSSKMGIAIMLGIFLIFVGAVWGFVPFPGNRDIPRPGGIAIMLLGVLLITTVTTPKLYFAEHPKPGHSLNYIPSGSSSVMSGLDHSAPSRINSRVPSLVLPRSPYRRPSNIGSTIPPSPGLRSRSPSPRRGSVTITRPSPSTAREWIPHGDKPPSYNTLCV